MKIYIKMDRWLVWSRNRNCSPVFCNLMMIIQSIEIQNISIKNWPLSRPSHKGSWISNQIGRFLKNNGCPKFDSIIFQGAVVMTSGRFFSYLRKKEIIVLKEYWHSACCNAHSSNYGRFYWLTVWFLLHVISEKRRFNTYRH